MPPAEKSGAKLNSDLCVIGEDRFIRVCLELPIHGFDAPFMWGVWTLVHPRKGGNRPYLELEPTEHPLSRDFHEGLTIARAQDIAEYAMHEFEGSGK